MARQMGNKEGCSHPASPIASARGGKKFVRNEGQLHDRFPLCLSVAGLERFKNKIAIYRSYRPIVL